ncbi:hypothetical protein M422DRAFT_267433 [Sphaerobolus stellatus SS14]|uniref:Unplaced genomic scaffold SPHSTscaffold_175, whole genome shotgun sequence n=1 Tax=Sphaerobolus stellatus (strain SS14) TaxID=990650 RepID=A0A0C9V056_SPHS4|nr:hypothetical protein M422DRAFT_267433 [Sphaerobolus stellatus SS14]
MLLVCLDPTSNRRSKVVWSKYFICDHAGKYRDQRDANLSPRKRRNRAESIKCECSASIYACQPFGTDAVDIIYKWQHTVHDPASLKDLQTSRNPNEVRTWLDERVCQGFDQKALKAMLRMTPDQLREASITPDAERLPFSIKIGPMDMYNAVRRKVDVDTRLAPELGESIGAWIERLKEDGWSILYDKTPGEEAHGGWTLGLCSPWQKELILEYGDTVCLDSTHSTCRGEAAEKVFLTTVLARDHVTGRGAPRAFMLTNKESHCPLQHFLEWLRMDSQFAPETIMIDCSDTEALAIEKAFPDLVIRILYCYWHLWQAWDKAMKDKLHFKHMRDKDDRAESVKEVRESLAKLLQSETAADFNNQWLLMQEDFADQKAWIKYMISEWIPKRERWAELDAKKLADALPFEQGSSWVTESGSSLQIRSFTNEKRSYTIVLTDYKIMSCDCPAYTKSLFTCKHMFLTIRVTEYGIFLPHAVIPARRRLDIDEEEAIDSQRAHKRRLIGKSREGISVLEAADYWVKTDLDEALDRISREDLTRLLGAVDTLNHLARDIMLARPDNATQW